MSSRQTTKICTVAILFLIAALTHAESAKRVGIFKDRRSSITEGMLKTLAEAGYETEIIARADLQQGDKLDRLDALFLPGGWNAYRFAGFNGRRNLVDFVAQGKGILSGAFRSGYVRTSNRPVFPQIGAVYNRVNGSGVYPFGSGPLTEGITEPFFFSGWDHLIVEPGPRGKMFLTDSSGLPVGVSGEIYGGRYIALGAFIGMDAKTEAMYGAERTLFLNCLKWLVSTPEMTEAEMSETRRAAELEFLRREKIYDYTLNERGPDSGPGVIVANRNRLAGRLESRKLRLSYAEKFFSGNDRSRVENMVVRLKLATDVLDRNYQELLSQEINTINSASRDELVKDNPFFNKENVLQMIEETTGKSEDEKKAIAGIIAAQESGNVWFDSSPKSAAQFLYGEKIKDALINGVEFRPLLDGADELLSELETEIKSVKTAEFKAEQERDRARVPDLIKQCSTGDTAARRNAALELGRIGDTRAVAVLIKLLDDQDEKVRTNAVLALGWLRAKEAVPALIKAAKSGDKWMKRRATQALGQIGDPAAAGVLIENIESDDCFVRENALLALGWLKAADAVPALIKIITDFDRQDPLQRGEMTAAIRALGHIGDERALPQLEYWVETADDFPAPRRQRYGKRIKNIYSTAQTLGLQGHADLAIAEIKAGGRAEIGIHQAEFLARYEKFYGLTKHFNFFIGRPYPGMKSNFPNDLTDAFAYMRDIGATGIHNAWGRQDDDPEEYLEIVRTAADYGLKWIDVMPLDNNGHGYKSAYEQRRQDRTLDKAGAEVVLFKVADIPSFQGFWTEEDYPNVEMTTAEFDAWLQRKYGNDYSKTLGINPDMPEILPPRGERLEANFPNRQVYAEFLEFAGERLLEHWREAQEWLHGVRKGCAFTFNNTVGCRFTYPGVAGRAGGIIDAHGPETYQSFGSDNAFMMELNKDGEARPVLSEFYNWYSPSPAHDVRGFAQHLMHGECFFNFNFEQIFQQAPAGAVLWPWDAQRWEKAGEIFQKARKLKEYLAVPESAANVALVASERTKLLFYSKVYGERVPQSRRWYQNQSGLWSALQQSQIPTDAIWTETMTPEKLKRYKVLLLSDAKSLTPEETDMIRQWVKEGGALVAGGTTSLFDQWGIKHDNYSLADVFGLDYAGHASETDPDKHDTYCFDRGMSPFPANDEGLDPKKILFHVYRDIKPVKSIGLYHINDDAPERFRNIAVCEYDMPLGYDRVKPASARVIATFSAGDPALTINKFGDGVCYFWTPIYPGLCYVASGWQMQANFKDFWPGVREILKSMINDGLQLVNAELPVESGNCPKDVEITVRRQPEKNRMMIHLLNLDPDSSRVRGIDLNIENPKDRKVKISYPDNGQSIPFSIAGNRLVFTARDFEVHDMILVEEVNQGE